MTERKERNALERISNVTVVTFKESNSEAYVYFATEGGEFGKVTLRRSGSWDNPVVQEMDCVSYIREIQEKISDSFGCNVYRADRPVKKL